MKERLSINENGEVIKILPPEEETNEEEEEKK